MEEYDILFETPLGVNSERVASGGHRVLQELLSRDPDWPIVDWEQLSTGDRERWREVAEYLHGFCAREIEASYQGLATTCMEKLGVPEHPLAALCFQAVVRHMANLMLAEDQVDLKDVDTFSWPKWLELQREKMENAHDGV